MVPKKGRARRSKPKAMEESFQPIAGGYGEKNEKSRSNE